MSNTGIWKNGSRKKMIEEGNKVERKQETNTEWRRTPETNAYKLLHMRMGGFKDEGRRRNGREGVVTVSLESKQTVASNKYQAPQGVGWGNFLLKINIKVQSPREGGGKKEKNRKRRRHKEMVGGPLFLSIDWAMVAGGQAGNRKRADGVVGRCLWMWLHCRLAERKRWFKMEAFRSDRAQETWEGSHLSSTRSPATPPNHLHVALLKDTTLCLMEWKHTHTH